MEGDLIDKHLIKQISIFAENKPGRLAAIAEALEQDKVNIYAFSIAEASGFGVVRALVDEPERAHKKLTELGYVVNFTDVMTVRMRNSLEASRTSQGYSGMRTSISNTRMRTLAGKLRSSS